MKKQKLIILGIFLCNLLNAQINFDNINVNNSLSKTGYDKVNTSAPSNSGFSLYNGRNILENSTTYNTAPNSGSTYAINYKNFTLEAGETTPNYQPNSPIHTRSAWFAFRTAPAYNMRYRIYDINPVSLTNTPAIISLYSVNTAPVSFASADAMNWYSGPGFTGTVTPKYTRLCTSAYGNMIRYVDGVGSTTITAPSFVPAPLSYLNNVLPTPTIEQYNYMAMPNIPSIFGPGISVINSVGKEYMELVNLSPNTQYFVQVLVLGANPCCPVMQDTPKVALTIIADIMSTNVANQVAKPVVSYCLDKLTTANTYVGVETEIPRALLTSTTVQDPDLTQMNHGYIWASHSGANLNNIGNTGFNTLGSSNYSNINSPYGNNNTSTTGNWYFGTSNLAARHHCYGPGLNTNYHQYFEYNFGTGNGYYTSFAENLITPSTSAGLSNCVPQTASYRMAHEDDATSVSAPIDNGKLIVYPNPSSSKINIAFDQIDGNKEYSIVLVDMNGKEIYMMKGITTKQVEMNIDTYTAGSYIVKMIDSNGALIATSTFVKK